MVHHNNHDNYHSWKHHHNYGNYYDDRSNYDSSGQQLICYTCDGWTSNSSTGYHSRSKQHNCRRPYSCDSSRSCHSTLHQCSDKCFLFSFQQH